MARNRTNIPKVRSNAVLIQLDSMRLHYPHFKHSVNQDGNLIFVGALRPSPSMPVYTISVEYRLDGMPRVKVLDPPLVEKPPHYHHSIDCLCLYKPANFTWTATKPISNYIVSWSACWCYFYEVWKQKGEWYGPEADHNDEEIKP